MCLSSQWNAEKKNSNTNVPKLKYLETTPTDQSCRHEEI